MFEIPECVGLFKRKFDVIEKSKLEKINAQLEHLKERNKILQKRWNVANRNEKYKF